MKVGSIYEVESYWTSRAGKLMPVYKYDKKGQKIRTSSEIQIIEFHLRDFSGIKMLSTSNFSIG